MKQESSPSRPYIDVRTGLIARFARFCTVLRCKMLFLQGLRKCRNSIFCTVLRYKMLLVQGVHVCTDSFCTVFALRNAIPLVRISIYALEEQFSFAVRVKMRVYKEAWR